MFYSVLFHYVSLRKCWDACYVMVFRYVMFECMLYGLIFIFISCVLMVYGCLVGWCGMVAGFWENPGVELLS